MRLAIGLMVGVGLLAKHTMLVWGLGLLVALLLTPQRRWLRSPWLWVGSALAALLVLPQLLWQHAHGWPTVEFIRNHTAAVRREQPRWAFVLAQVGVGGVLGLPLTIAALRYWFSAADLSYRMLGWIYVVVFAVLLLLDGKFYYLGPLYPVVF